MTRFALLVIFAVLVLITVIIWLIYLIKHKKKAALIVISSITTVVIAFCLIFPTSFPFVDSWIIGKSFDEVVDFYGDDYDLGETKAGKVISYPVWKEWTKDGLKTDYYSIYFDKDEKAVRVRTGALYEFGYRCGGVNSY